MGSNNNISGERNISIGSSNKIEKDENILLGSNTLKQMEKAIKRLN
ncbi:hypothetical protein JFL60_02740 [Histophilus somni]|nr:hypothetical protein [Histophilus somni]QQF66200.1 hypothetical protein JFL60_02740 [Histophilus somni]